MRMGVIFYPKLIVFSVEYGQCSIVNIHLICSRQQNHSAFLAKNNRYIFQCLRVQKACSLNPSLNWPGSQYMISYVVLPLFLLPNFYFHFAFLP